jgi:tetratricopeptide (TPR) repeat protein
MDLGRIDLALQTYSKAATHERGALARVGNANAYRTIGNLDGALNLYDTVLAEYPNNRFALCGRADVLRDQGKFAAALAAYELAAERSPYRTEPVLGKARTLRHMGRFTEALTVYEEARSRFPSDRRVAAGFVAVYRAQGRFEEALTAVDRLIAEYPFDAHFRAVRAGILSRLGKDREALEIYDAILAKRPTFAQAALGKAALLIRLQRDSEAAVLLPEKQSKTRRDWRQLLLKAFLVENQQGPRAASHMLRLQIPVCPFALERRAMRDLLATLELRSSRWERARQVVESNPEEVSNVIALHVLAATHQTEQARVRLEHVRESGGPTEVIDLAEEIARRHKLTPEQPHHSVDWIQAGERNFILAEAA